jgi:ABC-type phosphate transport system substrate-binding protein
VPAAGIAKGYGFAVAGWCVAAVILAGAGAYLYFCASAENLGSPVGSVQVVGSESMHPSVTACAEDFMTRNPQADVIVKGGGSGDGVAALLHGITDIAMASRELTQREREYARSNSIGSRFFPSPRTGSPSSSIERTLLPISVCASFATFSLEDFGTGAISLRRKEK